jgi:hypothetical protein
LKSSGARSGHCGLLRRVTFQPPGEARPAARPGKSYRGSMKRLKRITMRGNLSWEFWLLLAWVAFLLLVVMPWMIRQAPTG